jgi:DNA topoisomerase-1
MESAELERTTVDIKAEAGGRVIDLRATGQVIKFDGFLALYQDVEEEDGEDAGRLPAMQAGEALGKDRIVSTQHFTEPPPRYTEEALIKRMEELGIGRPSTYAATLAVLKDREYVRLDKKRLVPEDKGRLVTAFLESFFTRWVDYDFTASLEEQLDKVSNSDVDWKQVLRDFWRDFSAAIGETKDLRTTQVLDNLNEILGPFVFPSKGEGIDPRACPHCGTGQLSLKLGKFGAFIGCSNYPECKFTRTLSQTGAEGTAAGEGDKPGQRLLGTDPQTGLDVTVRDGRFGPYLQLGDGEKPKRSSLPKGVSASDIDLAKALLLLSLPREIAKHPTSGEPILAGIGRFGPYVQHGKTYANLSPDDDVLEIGGNRAIDLVVAKESGQGGGRFGRAAPAGRVLGDHPAGGTVTVRAGRYGPYVNWGKVNATLPKDMTAESATFEDALRLIEAKGPVKPAKAAKPSRAKAAAAKPAAAKPAAKAVAAKRTAKPATKAGTTAAKPASRRKTA